MYNLQDGHALLDIFHAKKSFSGTRIQIQDLLTLWPRHYLPFMDMDLFN